MRIQLAPQKSPVPSVSLFLPLPAQGSPDPDFYDGHFFGLYKIAVYKYIATQCLILPIFNIM